MEGHTKPSPFSYDMGYVLGWSRSKVEEIPAFSAHWIRKQGMSATFDCVRRPLRAEMSRIEL